MRDQPFKDPNCINNEKSYTNIVPRGYLRFCETRNPRSTQNLTALVLGNSHCLAVGPIINQDKRFSTVVRVSGDTCHFPSRAKREFCNDMITMDFEILEKLKPDIVFLFFAYVGKMIETPKTKITAKDPRFLYLNNTIAKMSKYTKAIIINDIDIRFPYSVTKVFLRRKRKGLETDSLKETGTIEKVSKEPEIRRCLDLLLQYCPICVIVRPRDAFCSNGICDPIDRKYNLPMFRDSGHVQGLGRRHYKPFIDKAISQALDIIGNSSHTDEH
ncbi:hypothetical protein FO519_008686 [Halicephalobus sp. NKZ332]|nr:hypothetical protein FO519_008686 [Halicephalobus sp. NKZ332]